MKKLFFITIVMLFSIKMVAQMTTTDSVKATINHFFEGMKTGDTALIRSSLTEGVIFQTIARSKEGVLSVRTENVNDFLRSMSQLEKGNADERIEFKTIEIDGALASVWTPYKFYFKGQFSHCGANSFQLVRIDGVWKIQYIIDTRRRQGCE
jgi:Putative lumazine-binding